MRRFIEYATLFVALVLMQVLLFNNIGISTYVVANVYIAFIILLPIGAGKWVLLLSGLACGIAIDAFSGTAGLHTMSALWLAFVRNNTLLLFAGKDEIEMGGIPNSYRLGFGKFAKYCLAAVLLFHLFFFTAEEMSFHRYYIVLLRTVLSSLVSAVVIYFVQLLFFKTTQR